MSPSKKKKKKKKRKRFYMLLSMDWKEPRGGCRAQGVWSSGLNTLNLTNVVITWLNHAPDPAQYPLLNADLARGPFQASRATG
jgi:hypothetical protein